MRRATVVVFVKLPVAGRVKTRLGRDIGMAASAGWFRHATARLLRRLRDPRWRLVLAVAPDAALRANPPCWPRGVDRVAQGAGDLGARMARALRRAGAGPAVVVGADIPGLGRAEIARAFAALGPARAVFGPAEDGGYWLVGLRSPRRQPRGFLRGVRWSTGRALEDSLRAAPRPVALTDRLADVDDAADLARLRRRQRLNRKCSTSPSATS